MDAPSANRPTFLARCRPSCKVMAWISLSGLIMTRPPTAPAWWLASLLILTGLWREKLPLQAWLGQIRRFSLLFLSLMLFHGFFVPGHWLWSGLPSLTREGLLVGLEQVLRLTLLATMAWLLATSTTPRQLLAVAQHPCGRSPRCRQGLALVAMTLRHTSRLLTIATEIRTSLRLRDQGWQQGPGYWVMALDALIWKTSLDVARQEQALASRGFSQLPPVLRQPMTGSRWRETLLLTLAVGVWLPVAG